MHVFGNFPYLNSNIKKASLIFSFFESSEYISPLYETPFSIHFFENLNYYSFKMVGLKCIAHNDKHQIKWKLGIWLYGKILDEL